MAEPAHTPTGKESKPNKQKGNFEEIEIIVNGMALVQIPAM